MANPSILALDIGTSSVRASLYDEDANLIQNTLIKVPQSFTYTTDGGAEIDAEQAFSNVVSAIDSVLEKTTVDIAYVASCAFWHSLVGIGVDGVPTTKVFGWADTRSRTYTSFLRRDLDEQETHNRTGARFHSSYWPAKLLWLHAEQPDVFARTTRFLSFSDLVGLRLFDDCRTSISMASGTGAFDIRNCSWDTQLLQYLNISPRHLPQLLDDNETLRLTDEYKHRWPRLAQATWLPSIGDGAADNIGSGCITPSRAALMIGTSGALRVAWTGEPPPNLPSGLWCYRIDRRHVVMGGAISDGGGLYQWLKTNLQLPNAAEEQIASRAPGANDLAFLPFLAGERSTGYNDAATGSILGLTAGHDSTDILQAAMEGVAFRFAEISDQLSEIADIEDIVASGGALRDSPVWVQIIANVLGRDLVMSSAEESASRGAVLHALESTGKIVSDTFTPDTSGKFIADMDRHAVYTQARSTHESLYDQIVTQRTSQ